MHWVARLERDNFPPGQFLEVGSQFGGGDCNYDDQLLSLCIP